MYKENIINLDIKIPRLDNTCSVYFNELDLNTAKITINLIDSNKVVDITDCEVYMSCTKPVVGNLVFNCDIIDSAKGIISAIIPYQALTVRGLRKASVIIQKKVNEEIQVISTPEFLFNVTKSAMPSNQDIIKGEEYPIISELIKEVKDNKNALQTLPQITVDTICEKINPSSTDTTKDDSLINVFDSISIDKEYSYIECYLSTKNKIENESFKVKLYLKTLSDNSKIYLSDNESIVLAFKYISQTGEEINKICINVEGCEIEGVSLNGIVVNNLLSSESIESIDYKKIINKPWDLEQLDEGVNSLITDKQYKDLFHYNLFEFKPDRINEAPYETSAPLNEYNILNTGKPVLIIEARESQKGRGQKINIKKDKWYNIFCKQYKGLIITVLSADGNQTLFRLAMDNHASSYEEYNKYGTFTFKVPIDYSYNDIYVVFSVVDDSSIIDNVWIDDFFIYNSEESDVLSKTDIYNKLSLIKELEKNLLEYVDYVDEKTKIVPQESIKTYFNNEPPAGTVEIDEKIVYFWNKEIFDIDNQTNPVPDIVDLNVTYNEKGIDITKDFKLTYDDSMMAWNFSFEDEEMGYGFSISLDPSYIDNNGEFINKINMYIGSVNLDTDEVVFYEIKKATLTGMVYDNLIDNKLISSIDFEKIININPKLKDIMDYYTRGLSIREYGGLFKPRVILDSNSINVTPPDRTSTGKDTTIINNPVGYQLYVKTRKSQGPKGFKVPNANLDGTSIIINKNKNVKYQIISHYKWNGGTEEYKDITDYASLIEKNYNDLVLYNFDAGISGGTVDVYILFYLEDSDLNDQGLVFDLIIYNRNKMLTYNDYDLKFNSSGELEVTINGVKKTFIPKS